MYVWMFMMDDALLLYALISKLIVLCESLLVGVTSCLHAG